MNRPEPTVAPFGPVVDAPGRPFIRPHRLAQLVPGHAAEEQIEQRLRAGSPKSGARHVRLTDSRQIGPNEFEELGSPFHWTVYAAILVVVFVLSAFGFALASGAGQL